MGRVWVAVLLTTLRQLLLSHTRPWTWRWRKLRSQGKLGCYCNVSLNVLHAVVRAGKAGDHFFSSAFDIRRGVVQGDGLSPVLFILVLALAFKSTDLGEGITIAPSSQSIQSNCTSTQAQPQQQQQPQPPPLQRQTNAIPPTTPTYLPTYLPTTNTLTLNNLKYADDAALFASNLSEGSTAATNVAKSSASIADLYISI